MCEKWPNFYITGKNCAHRYLDSRETLSPLDMDNKGIINAGISKLKGDYVISQSQFKNHVVFFTLSGKGYVATPELKKELTQGTIMIVPAGKSARYGILEGPWDVIWFDLAVKKKWDFLSKTEVTIKKAKNLKRFHNAIESLYLENHNDDPYAESLSHLISDEIIIYLERELSPESNLDTNELKDKLLGLFQEIPCHLQYPWSVKSLASKISISPSYLYALCKEHFGTSPMKQVTTLRIHRSKTLLEHTATRISEIATLVGYDNPYNFSAAFKRETGVSPSQYRNQPMDLQREERF